VVARVKRMRGFNVMHLPMGLDAFGANRRKTRQSRTTLIARVDQQKHCGIFSAAAALWAQLRLAAEIPPAIPEYYRGTSGFSLRMLERGCAYRKK